MSSCKFYGRHALTGLNELVNTHGNQCALMYEAYSPCRMETAGQQPDLDRCEMNGSARAAECQAFVVLGESQE